MTAKRSMMMEKRFLYAGLAGDSDAGRFISYGLYRSAKVEGPWEPIGERIHPQSEVRTIVTDPGRPGRVTVGTQRGIFRSEDHGETWRQLPAPNPGIAVWSLFNHPDEPGTLLAGLEPASLLRSRDDGQTWQALPFNARFPTVSEGPEMPKRVTGIAINPRRPKTIYASIEIGGLLRSEDDGETWGCLTEGVYVNEDSVDLHAVSVSGKDSLITIATRVGAFQSGDEGRRWRTLDIPMLRPRGTYCRALARAASDPDRIYMGVGNDFDGDVGALITSCDGGSSWRTVPLPGPLKTTVFALAIDQRAPAGIICATKYGHVFASADAGVSWRTGSLPAGAGHVFSLAVG